MAREYARIRISIASDRDFEALTPTAQWLFARILVPEPTLNHCGIADWRPNRLLRKAAGVTLGYIQTGARELEQGRYALFDVDTEEVLVRSYIRTEELLRNPKMAVAVIGAYRAIASPVLQAAVVSEVRRAHQEHPEYSSWKAGDVGVQLAEIMADKSSDEVPYVDTITIPNGYHFPVLNGYPVSVPIPNGSTVPITNVVPGADYQSESVPIPCTSFPADTSLHIKEGGYVSPEGHQEPDPDDPEQPPPRFCPDHPNGTEARCNRCRDARQARDRWELAQREAEAAAARDARSDAAAIAAMAIVECGLCDDDGYRGGMPCDHVDRTETAARGAALVRAELAKAKGSES